MTTPTSEVQERASAEEVLQDAERWAPWATQLVGGSIGIGIAGLVVLGFLINIFLLD